MKIGTFSAFLVKAASTALLASAFVLASCTKPEVHRINGSTNESNTDPETPVDEESTDGIIACTFNVRYYNTTDTYPWSVRKDAVMKFIDTVQPDLVGLQELRATQSQDFQYYLSDTYGLYDINRDTGQSIASGSGEGVGILYKKSRFTLKSKGFFWLAENPDILPDKNSDGTYSSWNSACRRVVVWTCLEDKLNNNSKVWYFASHFDHKSSDARSKSSELTVSKMKEITGQSNLLNATVPIFLVADFNCSLTSSELSLLSANLNEGRGTAAKTETGRTYNGFGDTSTSVIDHIFYGGPLTADTYHVATENYGVAFISDHYPVLLYTSYK